MSKSVAFQPRVQQQSYSQHVERRARRVYGANHPEAVSKTVTLRKARQKLVNAERTDAIANVDRLRDELAAAEAALAAMRTS